MTKQMFILEANVTYFCSLNALKLFLESTSFGSEYTMKLTVVREMCNKHTDEIIIKESAILNM